MVFRRPMPCSGFGRKGPLLRIRTQRPPAPYSDAKAPCPVFGRRGSLSRLGARRRPGRSFRPRPEGRQWSSAALCRAPDSDAKAPCPGFGRSGPLLRDMEQGPHASRRGAAARCSERWSRDLLPRDVAQWVAAPRWGARHRRGRRTPTSAVASCEVPRPTVRIGHGGRVERRTGRTPGRLRHRGRVGRRAAKKLRVMRAARAAARGPAYQPRSRHSWRNGRSTPSAVSRPCPG